MKYETFLKENIEQQKEQETPEELYNILYNKQICNLTIDKEDSVICEHKGNSILPKLYANKNIQRNQNIFIFPMLYKGTYDCNYYNESIKEQLYKDKKLCQRLYTYITKDTNNDMYIDINAMYKVEKYIPIHKKEKLFRTMCNTLIQLTGCTETIARTTLHRTHGDLLEAAHEQMKSTEYKYLEGLVGSVFENTVQNTKSNTAQDTTKTANDKQDIDNSVSISILSKILQQSGFIWLYIPKIYDKNISKRIDPTILIPHEYGQATLVEDKTNTSSGIFVYNDGENYCFYLLVWLKDDISCNTEIYTSIPNNVLLI